ncbi:MAG: hypothetical protein LBE56_13540 [Tannerella sp.]|nr:hypothetical protein [Tannerella sp.]
MITKRFAWVMMLFCVLAANVQAQKLTSVTVFSGIEQDRSSFELSNPWFNGSTLDWEIFSLKSGIEVGWVNQKGQENSV